MPSVLRWFRILPLTVLVASVFLTVKIGAIWHGMNEVFRSGVAVSHAEAAGHAATPPAAPQKENTPEQQAPKKDAPAAPPAGQASAPPPPTPAKSAVPTTAGGATPWHSTSEFTPSEVEVLQQLARRREALAERSDEIERREVVLRAAEQRIGQKLDELKAMQAKLEKLLKTYDEQKKGQIGSLIKIYENLKPKDAAQIFEELEMETLLMVAEGMNERKLAPVLAQLSPSRAKDVTEELAHQRSLVRPARNGQK
jgi:flagellar motility protein MotE (MotC chaperone)